MEIDSINLIVSKILHDIGNSISAFNLYLELIECNAEPLTQQRIEEINSNINCTFKLLKYAFCRTQYNYEIFNNLFHYLGNKGKSFELTNELNVTFSDYLLQLLINVVLLLSEIVLSKCVIKVQITENKVIIEAIGKERREKYIPFALHPENYKTQNVYAYFITDISRNASIPYNCEISDNVIKVTLPNSKLLHLSDKVTE